MTTITAIAQILLLVVVLGGILAALAATLRHDGYGRRPSPRSHRGEDSPWNPHAA